MEKEKNKRKPRKKKPGRDPKMQSIMTDKCSSVSFINENYQFDDFSFIPINKILDAILKNKK